MPRTGTSPSRYSAAIHIRTAGEHDAVGLYLSGVDIVVDQLGVDAEIPEGAMLQVGKLPVVVDNDNASHARCWTVRLKSKPDRDEPVRVRASLAESLAQSS